MDPAASLAEDSERAQRFDGGKTFIRLLCEQNAAGDLFTSPRKGLFKLERLRLEGNIHVKTCSSFEKSCLHHIA